MASFRPTIQSDSVGWEGEISDYIDHMGSGFGYVSAETIDGLNKAEHYFMSEITESIVVAPQIFYFEPHKLWYLVAQTVVKGETPNLKPI